MATAGSSFEGGSDEVAVSVGNSGGASGDPFDTVSIAAGGTLVYDTARAAHGSVSARCATSAAGTTAQAAWTTTLGTQTVIYGRAYLYLTAFPSSSPMLRFFAASFSGAPRAWLGISTSGFFRAVNSVGAVHVTAESTTTIPLNQWFRIEWRLTFGAATGQAEIKLFNTPDATVPTETVLSNSTQNFGGPSANEYQYGITSAKASAGPFWLDDLNLNTTGFPGPAGTSVSATVNVPTATFTLAAVAPVAAGVTNVNVPAAAFTLAAPAPAVRLGATVTVPAGAVVTFAALPPAVSYGAALAVPAATFTLAAPAPTVATLAAVAVPAATFTFAAVAPQLAYDTAVPVPAATFTLAALPPAVSYGASVTAPVAAFTFAAPVPVVSEGATVTVPAGATFTLAALPPAVSFGASVTVPTGATFAFAALPPVSVGGTATVQAPAATFTLAAPAPQVSAGEPVDVPAATIVLAAIAPQLSIGAGIGAVIQPSGPIIVFAAYPPSVFVQGLPSTRCIPVGGREGVREVAGREGVLVTAGRERGVPCP